MFAFGMLELPWQLSHEAFVTPSVFVTFFSSLKTAA
jgi:hypothetical protein